MKKPLGEEMEFFRQYDEVLFNQLEKKILDLETANQQLRILAKEYRLQFKNISDVVFMIGTDFNILNISPSVEKLLGYKAEDFIGRHASDLRHIFTPESFERAIANISKMLKGKRIPATIYTFVAKDGTLKDIEINGSPLIRNGQVAGTISVARDVTERKLMEKKLRHEEQRFRALVENSSDIIAIINLEGIITYINPAVERVLGFKPEERIGAKGFELVHPDNMKFLAGSFNTLTRDTNAPVIKGEMRLRHKDGSWRMVEAVGSNFVHNNVVEAIVVNYRDITERKRIEEALRQSEEKYRNILETIQEGYFEVDLAGNFTFFNDAICRLYGYSREELKGMNYRQYTDKGHSKKLFQTFNEVYGTGKPTEGFDWQIIRKNGDKRYIEASISLQKDSSGKPRGFRGILRDVTERKQAENVLRESEKKYRELSIIDDLTQLYNSKHFHAQLEIEIERSNSYFYGQPLTLLLLDLDKFKAFNDTYGHVEGDYVLSRLGQVIKRCLRETDSAYRYGGGEISIILPMTAIEEGVVKAKRLQAELRKEIFSPVLDQNIYMTVSIGLAQYKPMEELKMFVHRVEKLMYQAKKDGRDRICSDASRSQRSFIGST